MREDEDLLRDRLLAEVRQLPAERLAALHQWLRTLECGGLPPLFLTDGIPGEVGTSSLRANTPRPPPVTKSDGRLSHSRDWPRAPLHRLSEHGTYIVTAGTLRKEHYFQGAERLDLLHRTLLGRLKEFGWHVEAWAVFSNHYHFVAHAEPGAKPIRATLTAMHSETARELNLRDGTSRRKVWYNYWDTKLTYEKSYLARLNYVHQNAVKHGLVRVAHQYPWCSAAWFERTATCAQVRTIYSFQTDQVRIEDAYEPE